MKRFLCFLSAVLLAISVLSGCGNTAGNGTDQTTGAGASDTAAATTAAAAPAQKVVFWYNHKGDEAKVYEEAIKQYNDSQSKYVVEGLSLTDDQKLIVAMASNESPDAITGSNSSIITYHSNGLLQKLNDYVDRDKLDLGIYSEQALKANSVGDELYALPETAYTIQMFYNKDILKKIGYTDPPKTMEEMYEMADKATTLDKDGNIDVLGYPLFPFASARQELIYGFGGRWWSEDGKTLTPDSQGALDSLSMNVKYRQKYNIKKVQAFIATANTNRYTEKDMFFAGKQLFRLDGSWIPTMMKNFNSTVDYGITLVPGTKANPGLAGTSRFETDSLSIPTVASNKDGAWDFIKYFSNSDATKTILIGTGNLPALKALYEDKEILAIPGYSDFINALKLEKGIQYPQIADFTKYVSLIDEQLGYVYDGSKTPEQALKDLKGQSASLK